MSHDFARSHRLKKEAARKPSSRRKSAGIPSWLWLLVGTALGGLVMFLVYLAGLAPPPPGAASQAAVGATPPPAVEPPAPPKRVSPVFEFYTKLPEGGGAVTDLPTDGQPVPDPAAAANPPAPAAAPDPLEQLLVEKALVPAPAPPAEDAAAPPAAAATVEPSPAVAPKAAPAQDAVSGKGRFLQVGAFRSKAEVDKLRAKISLLGYAPSVQMGRNAQGETLHRVMVGPFRSDKDMADAKLVLTGNGISSIPAR